MNKKTIAGLIIMPVLLLLGGCTGNFSDDSKTTQATVAQETNDTTQLPIADDAQKQGTKPSGNCVSMDFDAAVTKLGISEQKIKGALGAPGQGPPDFAKTAKTLGITEAAFRNAIGVPKGTNPCPPGENSPSAQANTSASTGTETTKNVRINDVNFDIPYNLFTWSTLPSDVTASRAPVKPFTNAKGETHYYEAVYVPTGNLNWYQAAKLAEDAGGYLASITGKGENEFVFGLVSDEKYFWSFPAASGGMNHYEISIGPFLGGYQPTGSVEPAGGWMWLSGESMSYKNWAKNLDDGVVDKDPRPNDQPNNSGDDANGQRVMGFGEMNLPVSTWGDYMDNVGTYGTTYGGPSGNRGLSYGFVIEYNSNPN